MSPRQFQFGDLLRRSSIGPIDHYGVYLGPFEHLDDAVLDIQKRPPFDRADVRLCALPEFALSKRVFVAARLPPGADRDDVYERVERLLDAESVPYSLLGSKGHSFNCEHVARWVVFGQPTSGQADTGRGVLVGAAIGLFLAAISDSESDANPSA